MVWKCQLGKHEETVRVVYCLINEIIDDLPQALLKSLFSKVLEVPENKYTEMYLLFIKDFTLRALVATENNQLNTEVESINQDLSQQEVDSESQLEKKVFDNLKSAVEEPEKYGLAEG
jgi:hypothetical protein